MRTSQPHLELPEEVFEAAGEADPHPVSDDALEDLQGEGEGMGIWKHVDGPLEDPQEASAAAAALEKAVGLRRAAAADAGVDEVAEDDFLKDAAHRRLHLDLRLSEGVEACREEVEREEQRLPRRRVPNRRALPEIWRPSRSGAPGLRS